MIQFGEFAPDIADLNTTVTNIANNVVPGINSYKPFQALSASSDALTNPCQGAITLTNDAGVVYTYAGDNTTLNNISGVTVTDYSQVGDYTDNTERWSFTKWGDQVIASKWGDLPQVLTLGGTTFADLGGTPPEARTIAVVRDFVVLGNTDDVGDGEVRNRVWWSGFNDETEWTPGTNQSDFQNLEGTGGAVQCIKGGEYGIIFQTSSIRRMTYVGTPLVFQIDEIEPGIGTPAPGSVVQHGSNIYFLSDDGFYVLTDGSTAVPIGENKINRHFWDDVDESNLFRMTGAHDTANSLIVWSYPSTLSNGEPDKILMYNFKTDRWSTITENTQVLFTGATSGYTLEQLDSFGNMDTLPASLDSETWKGGSFTLSAFDSSNQLGFFTGATKVATIETGEISEEGYLSSLRSVRPIIDGSSTVTISARDNLTDVPVVDSAVSLDSTGKANLRTHARYHRIRSITSGDFTHAQGVEADVIRRGKR